MEGRMEGKRGRGRPRQKLMDWMMNDGYWRHKTLSEKLILLDLPDHIYNWMVDYFMDRGHSTQIPDVASMIALINASIIRARSLDHRRTWWLPPPTFTFYTSRTK